MQIFGLISLLIVGTIGIFWSTSNLDKKHTGLGSSEVEMTSQEVVNMAEETVGQINNRTFGSKPLSKEIEVYTGISIMDSVETLDLSGRGLSGSLKAEIRFLTQLKELDLSDNNMTGLPAELGQLSQLELLDVSNNPITGLPHEIGNLQNLKVLDLRGTEYSASDLVMIKQKLPLTTQIITD